MTGVSGDSPPRRTPARRPTWTRWPGDWPRPRAACRGESPPSKCWTASCTWHARWCPVPTRRRSPWSARIATVIQRLPPARWPATSTSFRTRPMRVRAWTPSGSRRPFGWTTWALIRAGRSSARGPRNAGVRSMLCLQLFVHRDTLGALDLLAHATSAFTDESEHVGLLLASHAAIAAADAQHLENVTSALVNRDVIAQAKGILMERFKITSDQAFAVLAKVSQDTNRKVAAVAEELTRTGMWTPGSRAGQERQDTP